MTTKFCVGATTILAAMLASGPAQAQEKPGIEKAAAAFGARQRIIDASLSPDGTKVALVMPGPKQSTIVRVRDLDSHRIDAVNSADGNPMTIQYCGWASDARIVCSLYGISKRTGPLLAYTRLVAMNADGSDPLQLSAIGRDAEYIQQSDGYIVDWRDGSTDKVLVARRYVRSKAGSGGGMAEGLGVDLLDTGTGKVDHIESADRTAKIYRGDGLGHIRIIGVDESLERNYVSDGRITFKYRKQGDSDWLPFSHYSRVTDRGLYPVAVDGKANVAYALKKTDGRDALYRVALDGSMNTELVFERPDVDVGGVVRLGRRGRIVGATYSTEKPMVEYFDQDYHDMIAALRKALPSADLLRVVDSDADGSRHLIYAASDTDPGRLYLFDSQQRRLRTLGAYRPAVAAMPIGDVKPITYSAADGTEVPGYLTLPPDSDGKKLRAIVMPHGGPAARDEWGFHWLAQFFVARGYAVLQPNYRGSTGYGDDWLKDNGFRSWKTAIGDVNDAGRWLVDQGIADPGKLAVVGWSYGGYAALQSSALDPDLYKAIVAIAPVTDLGMLRGEKRGFTNMKIAQDYIGEGEVLKSGSPVNHASMFEAPVMMFHGNKDINVDVDESKAMDDALHDAGKRSDLVIYKDIDHQLRDSSVREDMLTKIDHFLSESLG